MLSTNEFIILLSSLKVKGKWSHCDKIKLTLQMFSKGIHYSFWGQEYVMPLKSIRPLQPQCKGTFLIENNDLSSVLKSRDMFHLTLKTEVFALLTIWWKFSLCSWSIPSHGGGQLNPIKLISSVSFEEFDWIWSTGETKTKKKVRFLPWTIPIKHRICLSLQINEWVFFVGVCGGIY